MTNLKSPLHIEFLNKKIGSYLKIGKIIRVNQGKVILILKTTQVTTYALKVSIT